MTFHEETSRLAGSHLSKTQRAKLDQRLRQARVRTMSPTIRPRTQKDHVRLSFGQQRLWFIQQLEPNSTAYCIPVAMQLSGTLETDALTRSLNEVVHRHEVLRTAFCFEGSQPTQVIADHLELGIEVEDLCALSEDERKERTEQSMMEETRRTFDLSRAPLLHVRLLRRAPTEHILLLTMHHIVSDGWSMRVLVQELGILYAAFCRGQSSPLPELSVQYADFSEWQREWLKGQVLEDQLTYWRQQFKEAPTALALPIRRPRSTIATARAGLHSFSIDAALLKSLRQVGQQDQSIFMTLLAAFATLLYRYTDQSDLVIGSPIANRGKVELEQLIGFFANTLALRIDLSGNPTFRELLARVQAVCLGAYDHQDVPFEQLVEELKVERRADCTPLFQVMFVFQNAPIRVTPLPGLTMRPLEISGAMAKFDLTLELIESPHDITGLLEYNADLFEKQTIERLTNHLLRLLGAIAVHPGQHLSELPLLVEEERQQLLVAWNPTDALSSDEPSIHELFAAQVARTPDRVAVVSGNEHLTYRCLDLQSKKLARFLRTQQIASNCLVGLGMPPSLMAIVGLMGILRAGGAYIALDPRDPLESSLRTLTDTKISLLLTLQEWSSHFPTHKAQVVCLDSEWERIAKAEEETTSEGGSSHDLAYVTATYGSNALIEHGAVSRRLLWLQDYFTLSSSDVLLHQTSLAQDASIREIFWPLAFGSRVVVAAMEKGEDPEYLRRTISRERVSVVNFVPSALSALVAACGSDARTLSSLRCVICSGEPLAREVADNYLQHFGGGLYNLYSAPEVATEVAVHVCRPGSAGDVMPIGHPTPNTSVYILDRYLQVVPIGVCGEIHIAGRALARGYLQDRMTAQRFVQGPFSHLPTQRLFKTGERGRWREDGILEVLGPVHRQAWVKGFRVELGDVEAVLSADPSVSECIVLSRETATLGRELVAFVVPTSQVSEEKWKSHAEATLPPYMQPRAYVPVSRLPRTSTGQVDEHALSCIPVVDSDLVHRWEECLSTVPDLDRTAVMIEERAHRTLPLHLSDLVHDWSAARPIAHEESTTIAAYGADVKAHVASPPALSEGEPLRLEADAPATLPEALRRAAIQSPDKGILYLQADGSEIKQSYRDLVEDAQRILAGLRHIGLGAQDKVLFQLDLNHDFIPAFWACILGGIVPVPVSIPSTYEQLNNTISKLSNAWEMLGHPIVLTREGLAPSVGSVSALLNLRGFRVESVERLRGHDLDRNWHDSQPGDLAILLLTSGSTGMPKAVMQTHNSILSREAGTAQMNGHSSQDISLNWMPIDHVGGIVMFHIRDVYLQCQQVHIPTSVILQEPLKWLDLIERYRATITWAPNFAYGLINDRAEQIAHGRWDLSSMRFILNGGEAIVPRTARRFMQLLQPHRLRATAMHPSWGMSETCSGVVYSHHFAIETTSDDDKFVEVGAPIPGFAMRIVDDQNRLVTEGTIGRLQVRGLQVTRGYHQNPDLNREVFTDDGWFTTGDLGLLRNRRLTIAGREKDVIIIRGINYYAQEVEAVVEQVKGVEVSFTAACAVRRSGDDTDELAIFFSPSSLDERAWPPLLSEIRGKVVRDIGVNPEYVIPVTKMAIPKTEIGKIQRWPLRRRFEAGEFDSILKHLDVLLGNSNTLPDWFFCKEWCRNEMGESDPIARDAHALVFLDALGVGEALSLRLKRQQRTCIEVEMGTGFVQLGADHYQIDPQEPEHYLELLKSLEENHLPVDHILHLWTYSHYQGELWDPEALERAQTLGTYSLLYLIQALARVHTSDRALWLYVISSHTQSVLPNDELAYEKTPMLGLMKTATQELPWLRCRSVDLAVDEAEENAARVLAEMRIGPPDLQVAYRNGKRWVAVLEKVDWAEKRAIPFKPKGMYLVSGGLGGIGIEVAKYLLTHFGVRLLLVGRTQLPETGQIDKGGERNTSKSIAALASLRQLGEVSYESVDICDVVRLREVVERAQSRWQCELNGVVHLAGMFRGRLLVEESRESLSEAMRAKLLGTLSLHQLLRDQPEAVFISFSSVNGFLGGAMVGAYAAANSFLDSFQCYQRRKGIRSYCLAWSMWDEIGMSRGFPLKAITRARGYHIISVEDGLHAFHASLHRAPGYLLIGLEGGNPHIRRYVRGESHPLQRLTAYYTSSVCPLPASRLQDLRVRDRFGTKSMCEFVQIRQMPLTPEGKLDVAALFQLDECHAYLESTHVAPRTEMERVVAGIWQELLQVPKVGIQDNFFDLGGHSLVIVQICRRLEETFRRKIPITDLFRYPTVAALAEYLGKAQVDKPSYDENYERALTRRESMKRLRQMRRGQGENSKEGME